METFQYITWIIAKKPVPAPGFVKRLILKNYAKKYKLKYFVETGTFQGETIATMSPYFQRVDSIELSEELYRRAKIKFKNNKKVTIWQGDSGKILNKILPTLDKPTLFWLDAHGSGGVTAQGEEWSPIINELNHIVKYAEYNHVILIDDARGFTGHLSPKIKEIENVIKKSKLKYNFEVKDDIIRIILGQA